MRKVILGLFMVLGVISTSAFAADSYKIDPVHSNLNFTVKHMMVSNVTGQFDKYEGVVMYDPKDLASSKIDVTIQADSITTRNDKRDGHLKSPDFFDTAKFSTITFVSKKITASEIVGDLTMKGVTKEVTIPATITGPVKGAMGGDVIGVNGTFTINRQDYGISYNKTLDQGGLALSNDVTITIGVEADKQEAEKKAIEKEETKEEKK
jgi:polyisoprenoid-binding protein YceI